MKRAANVAKKRNSETVVVEPLEQRVLLSADAISAVMPQEVDASNPEADQLELDEFVANLETNNQPLELVFVDTNVSGYEKIIADLTAQTHRNFDIHILDGDGFRQVTETLQLNENVSSVHIISHGEPGTTRKPVVSLWRRWCWVQL